MTNSKQAASLEHIRVLDLTRVLAGPWCTQNLADLGADVIKVERPGVGDDTRSWGPPYAKDADGNNSSEAAYYLTANRGKRSITLDIATPEGQRVIRQLVMQSDNLIWIESNLPTRSFEKWLLERDFLNPGSQAPVVRWSIVQTQRPAHFVLKTEAAAIERRIAELMNPEKRVKRAARVHVMPNFAIPAFSMAA